jgi:hypothetical protein
MSSVPNHPLITHSEHCIDDERRQGRRDDKKREEEVRSNEGQRHPVLGEDGRDKGRRRKS